MLKSFILSYARFNSTKFAPTFTGLTSTLLTAISVELKVLSDVGIFIENHAYIAHIRQ